MNEIKIYKKKFLKLFYISIENDLEKWYKHRDYFKSPSYNGKQFDILEQSIYINDVKLIRYRFDIFDIFYIPLNIKANKYARKIRKHFRNIDKIIKNKKIADELKSTYAEIECQFIKHIRKEKLKKIR